MKKVKIVNDGFLQHENGHPVDCPMSGSAPQCHMDCAWFGTDINFPVYNSYCYCHGKRIGEIIDAG